MKWQLCAAAVLIALASTRAVNANPGRTYHVGVHGDDANSGSAEQMLKTISCAAGKAQPGDVITVHEGVYRERIDPPRGGISDEVRIVYQAAPGEKVVLKGSEVVRGWERVQNDTWKVKLPNHFFGAFNPYRDLIRGDWFNPKGRQHHTGAVYLDGHWLTEAARLADVLEPAGDTRLWFGDAGGSDQESLLNVAWIRPGAGSGATAQLPAVQYAAQHGVRNAPCSEGGECIGWIESGDWVRYENVNLGARTELLEFRVASVTGGGQIEIRLDDPDGALLGTGSVPDTGGWQSWISTPAKIIPTSGVKTLCLVFRPHPPADLENTTLWAQFKDVDPNQAEVEINVRQSVFYPAQPGINYLTVRGFTMMHAATPWAPPTAEQIGMIGTHWSKGWIIEDNDIRYSTCVGITLGKHGDEWDNTSANSAEGYVKTIERGLANGWSKENIGHHVVRRNQISHCEQAGLVGSLGAVFSTITDNVIHDIHVRQLFTGAEMAGIKLHAPIDTLIRGNHVYRTCRGIWLDWMTQGTRVTRNLLHDNMSSEDLFVEVNHGPFLVDHNVFLSPRSILVNSRGGAFAHNLISGSVRVIHGERRLTPFHKPHSTELGGLHGNPSGDDRYYNNLVLGPGDLSAYDNAHLPMWMSGNVYLKGNDPSMHESPPPLVSSFDPAVKLLEQADGFYLELVLDPAWGTAQTRNLVTTALLGNAKIPNLPYERPDGSGYRLDRDYIGHERDPVNPFPGPFEPKQSGKQRFMVWPAR